MKKDPAVNRKSKNESNLLRTLSKVEKLSERRVAKMEKVKKSMKMMMDNKSTLEKSNLPAQSKKRTIKQCDANWKRLKEEVCSTNKKPSFAKNNTKKSISAAPSHSDKLIDTKEQIAHKEREVVSLGFQTVCGVKKDKILARISIFDYNEQLIYDCFVKPTEMVFDYRTSSTGIEPSNLKNCPELSKVQREVAFCLKDKILVGHTISKVLKLLSLTHPSRDCRDIAFYKPLMLNNCSIELNVLANQILEFPVEKNYLDSSEAALILTKLTFSTSLADMKLIKKLRFMNELVLDYFSVSGAAEVYSIFKEEANVEDIESGCTMLSERSQILKFISSGNLRSAISLISDIDATLLRNTSLGFKLNYQLLIELLKKPGNIDKAFDFVQTHLAPIVKNDEQLSMVEEIMSLFLYPDFNSSPNNYLLADDHKISVASYANEQILNYLNRRNESLMALLVNLNVHLTKDCELLSIPHIKNIEAPELIVDNVKKHDFPAPE